MTRTGWRRLVIAPILLPDLAGCAWAHESDGAAPFVSWPLFGVTALFLLGLVRLWRKAGIGHGIGTVQVLCFLGGVAAIAGALEGRLAEWSETLFSAHMVEHELLMAVAAPLFVLARPGGTLAWGLPAGWRGPVGRSLLSLAPIWKWLTKPFPATVIHGLAIWVWHIPALFEAALESPALHWAQHASFFGSAILFWQAMLIVAPRARQTGAAARDLFFTSMHTGALGVLLTLSTRVWYEPFSAVGPRSFGMTPIEDQQLAGLIMWVPAGLVYAGAALALTAAVLSRNPSRTGPT